MRVLTVVIAVLVLLGGGAAPARADGDPDAFTPVLMSSVAPVQPVAGSDGRRHLVYELQLVNASSLPMTVESIAVRGPGDREALAQWSGERVRTVLARTATREPLDTLAPGSVALAHLTFSVRSPQEVPRGLVHELQLRNSSGRGPAAVSQEGGRVRVVRADPVELGPPLAGRSWVAADGCCDAVRHVRAGLPFGGDLHFAQRFAIDFEQLDAQRRLYAGPKEDVRSWEGYGEKVLAVASGEVVHAVNDRPDQVPGALPAGLSPAEADGNGVILRLRDGRYVLFAHMVPGSVTVEEGDRVRAGQVLGRVGNSGNSSAPHLHLHVMDRPAFLGADGLPYTFDRFRISGRIASTEDFNRAEDTGEPAVLGPVRTGLRRDVLPLDQVIVDWIRR